MNTARISARRTVVLGAATLGLLAAGLGAAHAGSPAISGKDHKVGICHATGSDSNPYVFIVVDRNSVKHRGHLMHRDEPNKANADGSERPDLIDGLDGSIKSIADCAVPAPSPAPSPGY